ncbi:MAG TPA: thiamine-phosphate kinase [Streptosporangiaceae bacterium]|nr:thiamine-phosphate kinase [Streptosporangiaceae bacterium]
MVSISDLGEFGFIADITARLPGNEAVVLGPGDDAAVVAVPYGRVVATTDLLLEGRHFRRDWSGPADIGAKAAARNLADVAAMGAVPLALLVGFAAPPDLALAWARELVAGLAQEGARGGAAVVGGDVSSAQTVMLAVTALGELGGREPVTRAGARPGDLLAVAGVLGHSAAGLALLSAGLADPGSLVAAHRRPQPPYQAGPQAALLGATAMIDISDGLVGDLRHVADASAVLIDIDTASLPTGGALAQAASVLRQAGPLDWVLAGGEDHALAATFPPGTSLPGDWTVIGRVLGGHGVTVDGATFQRSGGWDHFAG